jgi:hypothetical protein
MAIALLTLKLYVLIAIRFVLYGIRYVKAT